VFAQDLVHVLVLITVHALTARILVRTVRIGLVIILIEMTPPCVLQMVLARQRINARAKLVILVLNVRCTVAIQSLETHPVFVLDLHMVAALLLMYVHVIQDTRELNAKPISVMVLIQQQLLYALATVSSCLLLQLIYY
jgi:hypothetical protein